MRSVRSGSRLGEGGVCSWGGVSAPGGVCSWGGCLLLGGSALGVSAPGWVPGPGGGCLVPEGGAWSQRGSAPKGGGGIPACTEADPIPVDTIKDRCTVADGNNKRLHLPLVKVMQLQFFPLRESETQSQKWVQYFLINPILHYKNNTAAHAIASVRKVK